MDCNLVYFKSLSLLLTIGKTLAKRADDEISPCPVIPIHESFFPGSDLVILKQGVPLLLVINHSLYWLKFFFGPCILLFFHAITSLSKNETKNYIYIAHIPYIQYNLYILEFKAINSFGMGVEDIDFRKIIKFGVNSYVVSLPKEWMDSHNLHKGDVVYYLEQGDHLILAPKDHSAKETKSIIIEAENKDIKHLKLEIISAYLKNSTFIEIKGKQAVDRHLAEIRETLYSLVGMEIIEQTPTKIVAKDLIDLKEVSIDATIRRIDMMLRVMLGDVIECLDGYNPETLKHRDQDINRLSYLSFRLLNYAQQNPSFLKSIGVKDTYLFARWLIVIRIEEIGDHVKRIGRVLAAAKLDARQKKGLKDLYARIKPLYEQAMNAFYTKDLQLAISSEFQSKDMLPLITEFMRTIPNQSEDLIRIFEHVEAMISSIAHISREVLRKE